MTLVGSTGSGSQDKADEAPNDASQFKYGRAPTSPLPERINPKRPYRGDSDAQNNVNNNNHVPNETLSPPPPTLMTTPCSNNTEETNGKKSLSPKNLNATNDQPNKLTMSTLAAVSISPPNLTNDRRPSVGANVIPHAALCQHRHSLQMNGEGGIYRVRISIRIKSNPYKK